MFRPTHHTDRGGSICQDFPQTMSLALRFSTSLGDVVKHEHDATDIVAMIANRGSAVADKNLCAIRSTKQGVIGKHLNRTRLQHLSHRIPYRRARVRGDRWKDHFYRITDCVGQTPTGSLLSDIVQKCHDSVFVGGNYAITDATQRS